MYSPLIHKTTTSAIRHLPLTIYATDASNIWPSPSPYPAPTLPVFIPPPIQIPQVPPPLISPIP